MFYSWDQNDLLLQITVQTRASQDQIVGPHNDDQQLKIRICDPPVDNRANQKLIQLLAKEFKVAKSRVLLLSGDKNRNKTFRIINPQQLPAWVQAPAAG